MAEALVPIIRGRSGIRHAAVLMDNVDFRFSDMGKPSRVLIQACDHGKRQAANNFVRLPISSVECQRCAIRSGYTWRYFLITHLLSISNIARTFSEPKFRDIFRSEDAANYLVFADWLEEQGDPRGEWIRCAVELDEQNTDRPLRRVLMVNRILEIKKQFLS